MPDAKEEMDNKESHNLPIVCKELRLWLTTTNSIASGGNESFTAEFHFEITK